MVKGGFRENSLHRAVFSTGTSASIGPCFYDARNSGMPRATEVTPCALTSCPLCLLKKPCQVSVDFMFWGRQSSRLKKLLVYSRFYCEKFRDRRRFETQGAVWRVLLYRAVSPCPGSRCLMRLPLRPSTPQPVLLLLSRALGRYGVRGDGRRKAT